MRSVIEVIEETTHRAHEIFRNVNVVILSPTMHRDFEREVYTLTGQDNVTHLQTQCGKVLVLKSERQVEPLTVIYL